MPVYNGNFRNRRLGSITSASVTTSPAPEPSKINTPITNVGTILSTTDQANINSAANQANAQSAGGIGSFLNTLFGGSSARTGTTLSTGLGTFTNWVPLVIAAGVIYILMRKK